MKLLSTTRRISIVLLVGMSLLLALLLGFVWQVTYATREESRTYALSLVDTLTQALADKTASVVKAAVSLAQNSYVETYFTSDDINVRASNLRVFESFALNAITDVEDVLAVALVDMDGRFITMGTQMDTSIIAKIRAAHPDVWEGGAFCAFFTRPIKLPGRIPVYAYIMPVYDTNNPVPLTRLATCIVLCDLRLVQSIIDQPLTEPFSNIRLRGADAYLLCARSKELQTRARTPESIVHEIPGANWTVDFILDFSSFALSSLPFNVIWTMALIGATMLLSVGLILRTGVAKPVDAIIERLRTGSDLAHMGLHFGNELDIIVDTICQTFDRLERSTELRIRNETEMYAMQLHIKQSELTALQSQINPHFLYNTLECMRSIGLFYNSPEIVTISTAMADIFRYSIKGPIMVTLEMELAIIRQYLGIINVRFDDRFSPEYDTPPDTLVCAIPKMTLQPLVENAIYHGLEPKKGRGMIHIVARRKNDALYITVRDDGVGIASEELAFLNELLIHPDAGVDMDSGKRSIGLSNIAQRIRLFAKGDCDMEIESAPGQGTCVTLRIALECKRG